MELLDKLFHQYVGRVVAFVVMPVLTAASITVVPWVNDVLGTDLTSAQVANTTGAVIVGQILLGWQWLRNRGRWEIADKLEQQGFAAFELGAGAVYEEPKAPLADGFQEEFAAVEPEAQSGTAISEDFTDAFVEPVGPDEDNPTPEGALK